VTQVVAQCFAVLRHLGQIRRSPSKLQMQVEALVLFLLDYVNSMLAALPLEQMLLQLSKPHDLVQLHGELYTANVVTDFANERSRTKISVNIKFIYTFTSTFSEPYA
jgi:hypothetical protein